MLPYGRIISLLGIVKPYPAAKFFALASTLQNLSVLIARIDNIRLSDDAIRDAQTILGDVSERCKETDLSLSIKLIERMLFEMKIVPPTHREYGTKLGELLRRIEDELSLILVLRVTPERSSYYEQKAAFGNQVTTRFPSMAVDIEEAGNCLALGRITACIFHLMRAMEAAIQELGNSLNIPNTRETDWQIIQNHVNGALKRLPQSTKAEKSRLAELSEMAAHLQHVKDAWRNPTMHPKDSYTEDQGIEIYANVRTFIKHLATVI